MAKGNKENLIQYNDTRTPEERRECAKKAGKRSGEVRHQRKTFKDAMIGRLEMNPDEQDELITALFNEAKAGNYQAFIVIRDTMGEKPKDKVEVDTNIEAIKGMSDLAQSILGDSDGKNTES